MDIARSDDYGGVLRETWCQHPQHKIVREVIDRERRFESITCPMLRGSKLRTGIHNEAVDLCAVQLLRERLNERPNIRKTRQIQWQGLDQRILIVAAPRISLVFGVSKILLAATVPKPAVPPVITTVFIE